MPPGETTNSMLPEDVTTHFSVSDIEFCLLYTSDAADDLLCVDLGGRRLIKKKNYNKKILSDKMR